ncbi:hypothetical protein LPUS_06533 [Lasallia pustulata]|uniref:Uncharacterized protein n=1 Tax=Lasallia pustulata TaxID=136370 RepID=A0A1W5D1F7_9LECA|nr:hypothetical protein LPUS_06533 [Lasallia pustulata]
MDPLLAPKSGIALLGAPHVDAKSSKPDAKSTQVMRLDLAEGMFSELLKSVRGGGKGLQLSFGKTPTLHYGTKTQRLTAMPSTSNQELYTFSADKKDELNFTGRISHCLGTTKVEDVTAGTDAALLQLTSRLHSIEKAKESKKTVFVSDNSKLPPVKGEKRTQKKSSSLAFMKSNHREQFNNATTRSMPTSPTIGASGPPLTLATAPTSVPALHDEKSAKLKALRSPLIHLLAVRPVSERFLAQKTHCSIEECLDVLQKVGKKARLDSSKWDLTDRAYKELDVWDFNYPNQEDRQAAIDHAVSAFDRLRLSREEKVWQMLLPREERGKGKILSKLQLHGGPIQRNNTPRIHVQATDDAVDGYGNPHDSDVGNGRLAPNDAPTMVRSHSQDSFKKTRVSEKEAQSKRLLSKNLKKLAPAVKVKEVKPGVKRDKKNETSALPRKTKSAEFVDNSDEDAEMEDTITLESKSAKPADGPGGVERPPKQADRTMKQQLQPADASDRAGKSTMKEVDSKKRPAATSTKPNNTQQGSSSSNRSVSTQRYSDASQSSTSMRKTLSRQRNTSSPHKPSPLGSSPPTNASDMDHDAPSYLASSSSSSPLIAQRPDAATTPTRRPGVARIVQKPTKTASEYSLKRKASDPHSDIHSHDVSAAAGPNNPAKRHQTSATSPPTSDSSSSSISPLSRHETLELAKKFKTFHAKYEKLYREVSSSPEPPQKKFEQVLKMHERLAMMKRDIARGVSV